MVDFYGREDISLLVERIFLNLFGTSDKSQKGGGGSLAEFVAYVLYRTDIPDSIVFHSLHLLRRLTPSPSDSKPLLLLSSFILATKYAMDDAYSNKSWSIAAKGLFTVKEINTMEFDLLSRLGGLLRDPGEDLGGRLEWYQMEWDRIRNGG